MREDTDIEASERFFVCAKNLSPAKMFTTVSDSLWILFSFGIFFRNFANIRGFVL